LQEEKKPILQELSDRFSIDEKSLFQDIYGFSMVNDVNHPIYKKTAEEYFLEGNQEFLQNWFFFFLQNFNCFCIINCLIAEYKHPLLGENTIITFKVVVYKL
jgi:hypothetical protein